MWLMSLPQVIFCGFPQVMFHGFAHIDTLYHGMVGDAVEC